MELWIHFDDFFFGIMCLTRSFKVGQKGLIMPQRFNRLCCSYLIQAKPRENFSTKIKAFKSNSSYQSLL